MLDLAGGRLPGIDASAGYPTAEVSLAPGSVLVLYADGLVESPGIDIEGRTGRPRRPAGGGRRPAAGGWRTRWSGTVRRRGGRVDDVAVLLLRARDDG
ncbi:serine/threonine-protein phosphatase [Streptomyces tricolor]|nr:serine/threonine-protein phosphatase [Streptomyces tricolor]